MFRAIKMDELESAFRVGADGRVVALRAVRAEERFVADAAAPPRQQPELGAASAAFWRSARAAPAAGRAGETTRWYVECETLRSVRHGLEPSLAVAWLEDGRSCATALRAMAVGEEATRDWTVPHGAASVSRAALALELLPVERWADPRAHAALAAALDAATGSQCATSPAPVRAPAARQAVDSAAREVLIYTDYAALVRHHRPRTSSRVRLTSHAAREPLDGVWLATPITAAGWAQMPQGLMVNQFPREGALVRKDLLAATARAIAASSAASSGSAAPEGAASCSPPPTIKPPLFPPWCPVTFDLATEAHEFLAHARAAEALETSEERPGGYDAPRWIVKLAAGTHSSDPCITSSCTAVARYAASAPGGDRVVQAYERTPLLLAGHKFDVRVYVAVRSFSPLDAAVHCGYYGRVAAAPLAEPRATTAGQRLGNDAGVDLDAHLTVSWYSPGAESGAASRVIDSAAIAAAAAREGVDWATQVHPALMAALSQLFEGAGALRIGGGYPDSRALYGVDVLPAWRQGAPGDGARRVQPLVLECNFQGDLETLLERVPAAGGDSSETFVDDALSFLFAGAPVPSGWEPLPYRAAAAPGY